MSVSKQVLVQNELVRETHFHANSFARFDTKAKGHSKTAHLFIYPVLESISIGQKANLRLSRVLPPFLPQNKMKIGERSTHSDSFSRTAAYRI